MRHVGPESRKSYLDKTSIKVESFFHKYMSGKGLDIGYRGYEEEKTLPILPNAIGIDKNFPNYNGTNLPFEDNTQDFVYSSHTLEHVSNYQEVIHEWFRVLQINGYMIIIVPHKFLYEKKQSLPSLFNEDHKRFYTPSTLLSEVEESLPVNSYRVRYLEDNDLGYDYSIEPEVHPQINGCYEITLVIQKIQLPTWKII